MEIAPESQPIEAASVETVDEFASGEENRLRSWMIRLARWLFSPPYFPSTLIWPLLALILTDIIGDLLRQKPNYWLEPTISYTRATLGFPLAWGPWISLLIFAGYMLLLGLGLALVNRKLAFPAWVLLLLYHLFYITNDFYCLEIPRFAFLNPGNCSQIHAGTIALAGIVFALTLASAYALGLIPLNQDGPTTEEKPVGSLPAVMKYTSFGWALALGVLLGVAAFPTRPDWHKIETAHAPSSRTSAALAYDTRRNRAVLFGGTSEWNSKTDWNNLGDTWEWDGNAWVELSPAHSPAPRWDAVMAYDEARGVAVLFGGTQRNEANKRAFVNDTWEWDGQDWVERTPDPSPLGRSGGSLFYDPLRQKVILYGGYFVDAAGKNVFLDDVWEWDGANWNQVSLERTRTNSAAGIVFDPLQQLPMLMDGYGLWLMKDDRWFQPSYPQSPSARWGSRLAFDVSHRQVILFGGYQGKEVFNETWAFDGATWNKVMTKTQPPARNGHNLFFDATRNHILVFGGINGTTFYNDTWELVQP